MVEYLKKNKPESEKAKEEANVRSVVETSLLEIERDGDQAVCAISEKFDDYFSQKFLLKYSGY